MTYIDQDQLKLILKGKSTEKNTFLLTLKFSGGSMDVSNNWTPIFPKSAKITVAVDEHILYNEFIDTKTCEISFSVEDSTAHVERTLKIYLDDLTRENFSHDLNPMLCIEGIWIENLKKLNLITFPDLQGSYHHNSGTPEPLSEYMGCNGYQEIKFSTPIYRWLLNNHP